MPETEQLPETSVQSFVSKDTITKADARMKSWEKLNFPQAALQRKNSQFLWNQRNGI